MKPLLLSDAPLEGVQLHKIKVALKRVLSTQQPLTSPVKRYVECLANTSEHLSAQLAIAQKESRDWECDLEGQKQQKSGKRLVIKGQVLLTTKEI